MNIIHFTFGSVSLESSNGINKVIEGLAKYCNRSKNIEVKVVTLKKNLKCKVVKFNRDGFKVISFKSLRSLLFFFIKKRDVIDIVHLHNAWSIINILLSYILFIYKIPIILTPHSGFSNNRVKQNHPVLKKIFHSTIQKYYLDRLNAIHCISKEEYQDTIKYTNNKNIKIITNGIDVEKLNIILNKKIDKKNDRILVGSIGRISKEKNYISLIQAINYLSIDIRNKFSFVIVGEIGSYGKKIVNEIKKLELKNVKLYGEVSNEKKWEILKKLDIYIQPSLDEAGLSIAIREAMMFGLPIIATNNCKVDELENEKFIKIINSDPLSISQVFIDLIKDNKSFIQYGFSSKKFAIDNYDWKVISSLIVNLYISIVK